MVDNLVGHRLAPPRPVRSSAVLGWGLLLGGLGVGLALTNPGPAAFEEFAAGRLAALLREELCREDGLPLMLRLVIQDCPAMVESQRPVLGRLAAVQTRRRNLGLLSLYSTSLGGQQVLLRWRLPHYEALTLAVAGRFVLLRATENSPDGEEQRQTWLPGGGS
jgi:hypothetical protein